MVHDFELLDDLKASRLVALDNLLVLWGLQRKTNAFGGGVIIFHPGYAHNSTWMNYWDTEETWVAHIEWFVGTFLSR